MREAWGIEGEGNKRQWGYIRSACRDLHKAGLPDSPEGAQEILRRAKRYPEVMPPQRDGRPCLMSPGALATHWHKCVGTPREERDRFLAEQQAKDGAERRRIQVANQIIQEVAEEIVRMNSEAQVRKAFEEYLLTFLNVRARERVRQGGSKGWEVGIAKRLIGAEKFDRRVKEAMEAANEIEQSAT